MQNFDWGSFWGSVAGVWCYILLRRVFLVFMNALVDAWESSLPWG
jgi:hypothetical protein